MEDVGLMESKMKTLADIMEKVKKSGKKIGLDKVVLNYERVEPGKRDYVRKLVEQLPVTIIGHGAEVQVSQDYGGICLNIVSGMADIQDLASLPSEEYTAVYYGGGRMPEISQLWITRKKDPKVAFYIYGNSKPSWEEE